MSRDLLPWAFRLWLVELPVAALNWFLLAKRVYEPRVGPVRAHRIAMTTRMVWVFLLAYVLLRLTGPQPVPATLAAGGLWVGLWLAWEWGGSLLVRRPVHEILEGWHVERGYLWPYVLVTYLLAPVIVGLVVRAVSG